MRDLGCSALHLCCWLWSEWVPKVKGEILKVNRMRMSSENAKRSWDQQCCWSFSHENESFQIVVSKRGIRLSRVRYFRSTFWIQGWLGHRSLVQQSEERHALLHSMVDRVRGSKDRVNTESFDLKGHTLIDVWFLMYTLEPERLCSLEIFMNGKVQVLNSVFLFCWSENVWVVPVQRSVNACKNIPRWVWRERVRESGLSQKIRRETTLIRSVLVVRFSVWSRHPLLLHYILVEHEI